MTLPKAPDLSFPIRQRASLSVLGLCPQRVLCAVCPYTVSSSPQQRSQSLQDVAEEEWERLAEVKGGQLEASSREREHWGKVNGQKAMFVSFWLIQFCCAGFKTFLTNTQKTELLSEGRGFLGNRTCHTDCLCFG